MSGYRERDAEAAARECFDGHRRRPDKGDGPPGQR